jgi:hypothetical protein
MVHGDVRPRSTALRLPPTTSATCSSSSATSRPTSAGHATWLSRGR